MTYLDIFYVVEALLIVSAYCSILEETFVQEKPGLSRKTDVK